MATLIGRHPQHHGDQPITPGGERCLKGLVFALGQRVLGNRAFDDDGQVSDVGLDGHAEVAPSLTFSDVVVGASVRRRISSGSRPGSSLTIPTN